MWYVIQTMAGQEDQVIELMFKLVDEDLVKETFVPRYEVMKRIKGQWVRRKEVLLPGYVFVVTREPGRLKADLRGVPRFTRLPATTICSSLWTTARSRSSTRSPHLESARWSCPPA